MKTRLHLLPRDYTPILQDNGHPDKEVHPQTTPFYHLPHRNKRRDPDGSDKKPSLLISFPVPALEFPSTLWDRYKTPFGHPAEQADFEARTMINVSEVKGLLIANWFPPAADAIEDLSELGFTLNLEGAGHFHHLIRAGVSQDLAQLENAPIVML